MFVFTFYSSTLLSIVAMLFLIIKNAELIATENKHFARISFYLINKNNKIII
jgi:hypothetical protein